MEQVILKFYFSKPQQTHKINPRLVRKSHSASKASYCHGRPKTDLLADWNRHLSFSISLNPSEHPLNIPLVFLFTDEGHQLKVKFQTIFCRFPTARQSEAPLHNIDMEKGVKWSRNYFLGDNLPASLTAKGTQAGFLVSSSWERSGNGGQQYSDIFSRVVSWWKWHCCTMSLAM